MLLSDIEIRKLCTGGPDMKPQNYLIGMIHPFAEALKQKGVVSYGLSSYGYDVRLGDDFIRYKPGGGVIDPLAVSEYDGERVTVDHPFALEPGGFLLGVTVEYIRMPPNVTGLVKDKSTYARCGIALQNTVLEAGWHGQVTLEITNHSNRPVLLRPGEGIAQILFHPGEDCETTYAARGGKYQGQQGVTLPRVSK